MTEEAAKAPAGSDGVLWAPYLMGERTPHLDPHARAALVGLAASHTRGHVVRAVLEGVAFSLKDSFTIFGEMKVPLSSVRLGGGGARSPLWRQIQTDVYGYPAEIVEAEEGAAWRAAGRGRRRRVEDGRRRLRRGRPREVAVRARSAARQRWPQATRNSARCIRR
jgi:xylulokinase